MDHKIEKLNPSAPLTRSDQDLDQLLEKNNIDVNSFNNQIHNNKEMIRYFKDKNNKSKKRYKKHKTLTTIKNHSLHLKLLPQHRVLLLCLSMELV